MQAFKGLKAKDHPQGQDQGLRSQGQGLVVSRPRTWILALRTKAKD